MAPITICGSDTKVNKGDEAAATSSDEPPILSAAAAMPKSK